MGKKLLKT